MRFESLTPMLQSSDIARTVDWYRATLGFECTGLADGWCTVSRDGVTLMFMTNDHLGAPHATATQYFKVDDVMTLWNSVKDRVAAEWGPEEMPYEMLEFAIKDPDGYLLSFGQDVSGARATSH